MLASHSLPRRPRGLVATLALGATLLGSVAFQSCATVPPEAVKLSQTIGEDLQIVHTSYNQMVRDYFDLMRQETLVVFEEKFMPAYFNVYVPESGLLDIAKMEDEVERAEALLFWSRTAVERLDSTRKGLIEPINEKERAMITQIDAVFTRMGAASAEVTAHLNSVRKVHEAQDKALEAVGLKDLKTKVNDGLLDASKFAKDLTEKIEQAEGKIEKLDLGDK